MKAKYYIGIISALLLSGMPGKAQYAGNLYNSNGGTSIIVNNYDGNDYYYSSRINRFHRSYVAFEYYSPVFTSTYWYGYNPILWGASPYDGGFGFNPGYNFFYPVYYSNTCYFDYGWNLPFWYNYNSYGYTQYSVTFFGGYDPFFYNYWYGSNGFHINYGPMWAHNYPGWNSHDYFNHKGWNDNRPVYHSSPVNGHNNHQVPDNPARNDNAFPGSSRQIAEADSRQRIPTSDTRRTDIEKPGSTISRTNVSTRPETNSRPGYDNNMNRQPVNRKSTQLTAERPMIVVNQPVSNRRSGQLSEETTAMNNLPENRRNYSQPEKRSMNMDQSASGSGDNGRRK